MNINELKFAFRQDYGHFPLEFSEPVSIVDRIKTSFSNAFLSDKSAFEKYRLLFPKTDEKKFKAILNEKFKRAFELSKAVQADYIQKIFESLDEYEKEQKPLKELKTDLTQKLMDSGFMPDASKKQRASRIDLVIENAISINYARKTYEEIQNAPDSMRYRKWTQIDRKTKRKDHTQFAGKIFDTKDPLFAKIMPQKGHKCKCKVDIIVSEAEAKKQGIANIKELYDSLSDSDKEFTPLEDFKPDYAKYDKGIGSILKGFFK